MSRLNEKWPDEKRREQSRKMLKYHEERRERMGEVCIDGEWRKIVRKTRPERVRRFQMDKVCKLILNYIRKKKGAHLNELAKVLGPEASRVTILNRLTRLEDNKIIESKMERTGYNEKQVQKWMRIYRLRGGKDGRTRRIREVADDFAEDLAEGRCRG